MNQVIKNFFPILTKGKILSLALLIVVALGLFFPLHPAYAILGVFGGIADAIGKAIGWVIVAFVSAILSAILAFAATILSWSVDPLFITVPYTSGGIVDIGWPVVRDLANMFIVLGLVFIGLGTALRLQEYQARRTLPLLIGVALLINFTPVILGVIVDASNIVMNFFLEGLTGGGILSGHFLAINSTIAGSLGSVNFFNPLEMLSFIIKLVVIGGFTLFAFIIFLLFAFLFIIRRVAIWMLVILSPLAFVAYIFPGRPRAFFNLWWNQFVQWTIIGIFAAFFLWLGDHMIGIAAQGNLTGAVQPTTPIIGPAIASIFNDVLPYGVALIFLLIGFFVALSTSAMGASGIVAGVQRGVRGLEKAAGRTGINVARGVPAVSVAESRIRQRMERTPGLSALVGGPGAYAAETDRDRDRAGRNLKAMGVGDIRRVMQQTPRSREEWLRRASAFKELADRNRLEADDEQYFQDAFRYGVSPRMITRKMPSWAVPGSPGSPPPATPPVFGVSPGIREHVERQQAGEFRSNVRPHAFETPPEAPGMAPTYTDANLGVFYSMDIRKVRDLGLRGSREQKEALRNLTNQRMGDIMDHIDNLEAFGVNTPQYREAAKLWEMLEYIQDDEDYVT